MLRSIALLLIAIGLAASEAVIAARAADASPDHLAAVAAWRAAVAETGAEGQRVRWLRDATEQRLVDGFWVGDDGLLVQAVLNKDRDDAIVRVDPATGTDRWRTTLPRGWYCHLMGWDGSRLLVVDGAGLAMLDPASGALVGRIPVAWQMSKMAMWNIWPVLLAAPGCRHAVLIGRYAFRDEDVSVALRFDLANATVAPLAIAEVPRGQPFGGMQGSIGYLRAGLDGPATLAWDLRTGAAVDPAMLAGSDPAAGIQAHRRRTRLPQGQEVGAAWTAGGLSVTPGAGSLAVTAGEAAWTVPLPAESRLFAVLPTRTALLRHRDGSWSCRDLRADDPQRPWREQRELRLAAALLRAGDRSAAEALAVDLARRVPELVPLALLRAQLLAAGGRRGEAMAMANAIAAMPQASAEERAEADGILAVGGPAPRRQIIDRDASGSAVDLDGPFLRTDEGRLVAWDGRGGSWPVAGASRLWRWGDRCAVATSQDGRLQLDGMIGNGGRIAAFTLPFDEILPAPQFIYSVFHQPMLAERLWLGWSEDRQDPGGRLTAARPGAGAPVWSTRIPGLDSASLVRWVVADGGRLFLAGGGLVACLGLDDGRLRWTTPIPGLRPDQHHPTLVLWPTPERLHLVVAVGESISWCTFDPADGTVTERQPPPLRPDGEHVPVLLAGDGRAVVASHPRGIRNRSELACLDLASGAVLWRRSGFAPPADLTPDRAWLRDGRLLLQDSFGLSELEPATGRLLRRLRLAPLAGMRHINATCDGEAVVISASIGDQIHALRFTDLAALVAWVAAIDPAAITAPEPVPTPAAASPF